MAIKIRRISRGSQDLNLTSVSDIVFLMLIYFMVVCIFQQDIGLPFVLPAEQEKTEVVKIRESNIADLVIDANNLVSLDDMPLPISHIRVELERRLAANPKLVVMLKTHPEADYGTMVDVLDEVRLADCKKMALKLLEV